MEMSMQASLQERLSRACLLGMSSLPGVAESADMVSRAKPWEASLFDDAVQSSSI